MPFESTKNIFTKVSKKERLKGLFSVSKGVLPADCKFDREEAHESKYSVYLFPSQFFKKSLNLLARGYTQISLMGTLIFPGGPSFPRPLVCPTLIQLAAL